MSATAAAWIQASVAILTAAFAAYVAAVGFSERLTRRLLCKAFLRVAARPGRYGVHPEVMAKLGKLTVTSSSNQPHSTHRRQRKAFGSAVVDAFDAALRHPEYTPGDLLAELLTMFPGYCLHWWKVGGCLYRFFRGAALPGAASRIARIRLPDDYSRARQLLDGLVDILQPFDRYALAKDTGLTAVQAKVCDPVHESFSVFATRLTGAVVLADVADARSRCADEVAVWHSISYLHEVASPTCEGRVGQDGAAWHTRSHVHRWDLRTYECDHNNGKKGCGAKAKMALGDRDQRVLNLWSVSVANSSSKDRLAFVLEVGESCYATSEGGEDRGCKHVAFADASVENDPRWTRACVSGTVWRKDATHERVSLPTAQLALITSDRFLVVANRGSAVRNAPGSLSASAGGVVGPGEPGRLGDVDDLGVPSFVHAAARECREEIGLCLDPGDLRPAVVYQLNTLDLPTGHQTSHHEVVDEGGGGEGQLGTAVLFVAQTVNDLSAVRRCARIQSDLSKGRHENASLVGCPVDSPEATARWFEDNRDWIDDHGAMSVLYATMVLWGGERTRDAFARALPAASPWVRGRRDVRPVAGLAGWSRVSADR